MGQTARATVLVVERDVGIRELLQEALEIAGYGVVADAGDGATWPPPARPDLILLDVSGWEVGGILPVLRLRAAAAGTPVVAMTTALAHARPPVVADAWLAKPFRLAELYAAVEHWAGQRARSA